MTGLTVGELMGYRVEALPWRRTYLRVSAHSASAAEAVRRLVDELGRRGLVLQRAAPIPHIRTAQAVSRKFRPLVRIAFTRGDADGARINRVGEGSARLRRLREAVAWGWMIVLVVSVLLARRDAVKGGQVERERAGGRLAELVGHDRSGLEALAAGEEDLAAGG
jgi:hypothetical protein